MSRLRSSLYAAARVLGDAEAVAKGRIADRLARKFAWRAAASLLGSLFKRSKKP